MVLVGLSGYLWLRRGLESDMNSLLAKLEQALGSPERYIRVQDTTINRGIPGGLRFHPWKSGPGTLGSTTGINGGTFGCGAGFGFLYWGASGGVGESRAGVGWPKSSASCFSAAIVASPGGSKEGVG